YCLRVIAEVKHCVEFFSLCPADDPEYRLITVVFCPHFGICIKYRLASADFFQFSKSIENASLYTAFILDILHQIPVEFSSVDIAGVRGFLRIILIGIVIYLPDLISAVE